MNGAALFLARMQSSPPDEDWLEKAFTESPARMRGEKGPSRIMYLENKSGGLTGPARIGRVGFSKSGRMIYYQGHKFRSLKGHGFKSNYIDVESGDYYWIIGFPVRREMARTGFTAVAARRSTRIAGWNTGREFARAQSWRSARSAEREGF